MKASIVHLGFPGYFRVELSWAKFLGLAAVLVPGLPARLKEYFFFRRLQVSAAR